VIYRPTWVSFVRRTTFSAYYHRCVHTGNISIWHMFRHVRCRLYILKVIFKSAGIIYSEYLLELYLVIYLYTYWNVFLQVRQGFFFSIKRRHGRGNCCDVTAWRAPFIVTLDWLRTSSSFTGDFKLYTFSSVGTLQCILRTSIAFNTDTWFPVFWLYQGTQL
jgi:hypothetical protein